MEGALPMQYILSWLPVLACPVGMGLMMWFMMRGNKQQTPGEAGHTPMQTDSQPLEGTEPSGVAAPPKSAATFNLLGMCLNWKVLAGLAVVGLIVLVGCAACPGMGMWPPRSLLRCRENSCLRLV